MSRSFGASAVTSRSPMWIDPSSTGSSPASIRSVVDLPHPDGPTSTRNSPSSMAKSRWSRAGCSSAVYVRVAPANVTSAIAGNLMPAGATPAVDQTGVVVEIRTAVEEDWRGIARVDTQAFGYTLTREEEDRIVLTLDLSRFRIAVDAGDVVGVAGSYELLMTMPGGRA